MEEYQINKLVEEMVETRRMILQEIHEANAEKHRVISEEFQKITGISNRNFGKADMEEYETDGYEGGMFLGSGVSGIVTKVRDLETKELYAQKKMSLDAKAITPSMDREMSIMYDFKHENIVRLERAYSYSDSLRLIMEYVSSDLNATLQIRSEINLETIKSWMKQLLYAIDYLSKNNVILRDLKPENILVDDDDDKLKLADFGSARGFLEDPAITPKVTTLQYRAPEVLLGSDKYGKVIDMWAIGCIFAEMMEREPLFGEDGDGSELNVICSIFTKLGTPKEGSYLYSLPDFPRDMQVMQEPSLETKLTNNLDDVGYDLLMVAYEQTPCYFYFPFGNKNQRVLYAIKSEIGLAH